MAKSRDPNRPLRPWSEEVKPRQDLIDGVPMDAAEFAVHLDQVHTRAAGVHPDYLEPDRFFARTYVTGSLLELTSQIVRRLSGQTVGTSAVFNMATQFGGGKTHALTALYHLARHGSSAHSWKGVERILNAAEIQQVPLASVGVFVGTDFDLVTGRGMPGEPRRKTPWGELAWQLGGAESFQVVAEHDARGIAPGGDAIRQMLPAGPVLILMDEVMNFVIKARKADLRDQFHAFLHSLSEEFRGRKDSVLCVSMPSSTELESNPEDVRDYQSLKKLLDRVGRTQVMSADREIAEIIRRRLFDWPGVLPEEARRTIRTYADWAIENQRDLYGVDADTIHAQFESCYPFHPSVLSVFERKWQSVPRFQRTRGILQLLALWVAHNYRGERMGGTKRVPQEPLITLGLAPLDNKDFRAAVFAQLGNDRLDVPVTTDVFGREAGSHAVRLDKEAHETLREQQLHRRISTAIFFESNGGMSADRADATVPELRTDIGGPDINFADVDTALEGLASTCFYLQWERGRYRFGMTPNLNQVLVTRRGAVQHKQIDEEIRKQTQDLFRKDRSENTKLVQRVYFPQRSNDVPELPQLTLVVLGLDHRAGEASTTALMETLVRKSGLSDRTFKSALIFAVADASENVEDRAREWLAWQDIRDDDETIRRFDTGQQELLKRNLGTAERAVQESLFRAYRHLYLLSTDNTLRHVDLGNITSSSAASPVEAYLQRLGPGQLEEITDAVSPRKLLKMWPTAMIEWSTKSVRDAFYSSPLLPRLFNPNAVGRMIADGVTQGLFSLATKGPDGQFKLEDLKTGLFEADVKPADDVFILKAADAQKLKEPPRLDKLIIKPDHPVVKVGEQVSFTCLGVDQYAEPFAIDGVTWSATIGTVTPQGLFTAGSTGGLETVKAQIGACETLAEVRIIAEHETPPPVHATPGEQFIRWRGTVPSQKWMNFYTKVLSKFANAQGLKIEVNFEVKVDQEHADAKASETRSGLKELGLGDQVDVV